MKRFALTGFAALLIAVVAGGCHHHHDDGIHRHPVPRVEDPYKAPRATPVRDHAEGALKRVEHRNEQRRKALEPLRPAPEYRVLAK